MNCLPIYKSFKSVIFLLLIVFSFSAFAQKKDTTSVTYFSNRHPIIKSKYSLYLVFKMSNFLKPTYKVVFNFKTNKNDTILLAQKDLISDSLPAGYAYHFHEMGQFVKLGMTKPQTVVLLDENYKVLGFDIIKAKEINKLAEMYATPSPQDLRMYKIRYYKLTGIAIHGVGDVKEVEINNPLIRMNCQDKKKHYSENGIDGQKAMLGY